MKEEVQDNQRERLLKSLLRLSNSGEGRNGTDAIDEFGHKYELKTTTIHTPAWAKKPNLTMVRKYKGVHQWVFVRGDNLTIGYQIHKMYYLSPDMMMDYLQGLEDAILAEQAKIWDAFDPEKLKTFSEQEMKRLKQIIMYGTGQSPFIPWEYIEDRGIQLFEPYDESLRLALQNETVSGKSFHRIPTLENFWN